MAGLMRTSPPVSPIADYLSVMAHALAFDRALARRVCGEVEDHLREAAFCDPAWPSVEAERRAVARFGPAHEIAAQFAGDAVQRQSSRTWWIVLAAVSATFLAMRLRTMWLEGVDYPVPELATSIDRYGFGLAVVAASIGWWLARRSTVPLFVCVSALAASIAAGIARADLLAAATPLHVIVGTLSEVALLAMLAVYVLGLHRRIRYREVLRRA
jgi:hypothetical protein